MTTDRPLENRLRFDITDPSWNDQHMLVTLVQQARTILFDAGPMRMPKAIAHQIRDVCLTHRHMDHLMGFPTFARTVLSTREPIRVYGPRGTTEAVSRMLRAFEWNYKRELKLKLDIVEVVDEAHVIRQRLDIRGDFLPRQAGEVAPHTREPVLHRDRDLEIRAFDLEHNGVPVLGYRLQLPDEWHVDPQKLAGLGARPGPWLGKLLARLERGDHPDPGELVPPAPARRGTPAAAADAPTPAAPQDISLTQVTEVAIEHVAGPSVGFVTDTGLNDRTRATLAAHLTGVDLLCCEAFFAGPESRQAEHAGHLTAEQTAEIANMLGAGSLIVTHISQRYNPARILRDVRRRFANSRPKTQHLLDPAAFAELDEGANDEADATES